MEEKLRNICSDTQMFNAISTMLSFEFVEKRSPAKIILDAPPFFIRAKNNVRVIARDTMGGFYCETPDLSILYVKSDGRVGIIASCFEELICLLVLYPFPVWTNIVSIKKEESLNSIVENMMDELIKTQEETHIDGINLTYMELRSFLIKELSLSVEQYSIRYLFNRLKRTDFDVEYDNGVEVSPNSPFIVHFPKDV